ncbi:MAG: isochorismatase family protein [Chloroflexi bacterium AL-W]|nr:isochorismatase family protein [Chloroflexi bacterium AL-N1]NOK66865.1 isochorismatase family protein [Chloroflexi bacterium AL-N10]NOK74843.1 isochorismatase family protein [Chloroflexi bacterium AL-N5]NOK81468.1 isochorismatase family protein [Chloroflexi bacterium AL-W]NOK88937.1 isochorismatase family protein [Chloroflexi bacterium AL-N15]
MEKAYGLEIPQNLEEACHPHRTALLVYDMQVGIISQMKNGREIVRQTETVLSAARKAGLRVFFLRHMSLPKEASGVFQLRMAMAWQRVQSVADVNPWFLRDSPGFQLVPELAPLTSEVVFDKITMSAFEGTPLDIALRDCGINSFIIVGVATEIGIEPTIRHGADLGYIPIMVTDACGAGHEEAGERSVTNIKFIGDTILTDTQTICKVLEHTSI